MDIGGIARERWARRSCGRLFHGVGEGKPGLTIDRYGPVCLVQTWREGLSKEAMEELELPGKVVYVPRGSDRPWHGPTIQADFDELDLQYVFRTPDPGADPVLFLDLRATRRWLKANAKGRVLNAFSYTCGAGLAAASNGADVLNLDHGVACMELGREFANKNELNMRFLREDYFCAVRQFAGLGVRNKKGMRRYKSQKFELVVLDPPNFAKGPFGAVDIVRDYGSLARPALGVLTEGGRLLATNHHAKVDYDVWVEGIKRTATKAGRSITNVERIKGEDDFPSFDGNPPLKVAVFTVGG
jgi:23S rRNA (cytosine1962-C5)-methyltransferase